MIQKVRGTTAVITGATSGIGHGSAVRLGRSFYRRHAPRRASNYAEQRESLSTLGQGVALRFKTGGPDRDLKIRNLSNLRFEILDSDPAE